MPAVFLEPKEVKGDGKPTWIFLISTGRYLIPVPASERIDIGYFYFRMVKRDDKMLYPYDVILSILNAFAVKVEKLVIFPEKIDGETYSRGMAILEKDGKKIEIKMRGAEAVILHVLTNAPLFVHKSVLEEAVFYDQVTGKEHKPT